MQNLSKFFLYLTVVCAPLYVVRFKVGAYPSTLLEVLIGLTVVLWVWEKLRARDFKLQASSFKLQTILFLLVAAISVVVSPDKRGALGAFKAYFFEPILIYVVSLDLLKTKRDWWRLLTSLMLSGLWVAALAAIQGLLGYLTVTPHEALAGRAHAVYDTANAVGLYLGPIIALGFGALRLGRNCHSEELKAIEESRWDPSPSTSLRVRMTRGVIYTLVTAIAAIILSKSAGALIGLAAIFISYLLSLISYHFPQLRRWLLIVAWSVGVFLVVGFTLFFLNIHLFTPKIKRPFPRPSDYSTTTVRLCLWEGTRDLLKERFFLGAGLSGFKELYTQKYATCDVEPLEYPHNWVLNFWTEMGLLGLVSFGWIVWRAVRQSGSWAVRQQEEKTAKLPNRQTDKLRTVLLSHCLTVALIYWLVHGLVDVPYFKNDLALEFWIILALLKTWS